MIASSPKPAAPDLAAPDIELPSRMRLAVTRLARRLRQEAVEGLTPSQTSALASIDRHGALTPSELAAIEQIQRPTATRVLGCLKDAGLVVREPDASDKRVTRVRLSQDGAALLKRVRTRKNAYLARRLDKLDPDELATLERAAELIERLLEDDGARPGVRA
jgi:DNA-binding MarR family transcriptional regulator